MTKRVCATAISLCLAALYTFFAVADAGDIRERDLVRGTRIHWDSGAFGRTPRTWPVEDPEISNCYGRIEGVIPVWIEGERYRGKTTRVFAWWGLPEGAAPDAKVPAIVLVHGGGGTAFARWVKIWNDRGYAAIAMDTCGKAPRGERDGGVHPSHDRPGPPGWDASVDQIDDPVKDQWTFHAVSAIARCHSFIRSRPEVDGSRTGITGISWGGYLTSIAMCVDRRFAFAAPVYGCGYYELNSVWTGMNADPLKFRKWVARWDPKNFLQDVHTSGGVRCPVLWCNGTNDRWYTLEMFRKSCNLVDPDVQLSLSLKLRMPHGHPPAGDPPEVTAYADHYLKGSARPPRVDSACVRDGRLRVSWSDFGDKVVRAELLSTSSSDAVLKDRLWTAVPVSGFDVGRKACEVPVPASAQMFFLNLVNGKGLVVSTRIFKREDYGLADNPCNPSADWMRGKLGIFMHYLPDRNRFPRIGEFNVKKVVSQLVDMKADYFVFTLGQNSGYFTSPNAAYDSITGYKAGERCSKRDIPSELIAALKPHGIRFMLYLPCQAPYCDAQAVERFGLPDPEKRRDHVVNSESVAKWASVIREWSLRYGKGVDGWWFDGGYQFIRVDDGVAAQYAAAVKAGNPDAVFSMNEGVRHPVRAWTRAADYVPGEIDEPFLEKCPTGRINGRQWHLLTFAGRGWGRFEPRYSDERWTAWLKAVTARGGAVSLDLGRGATDGVFSEAQVVQCRSVFSAVRKRTASDERRAGITAPVVVADAPVHDGLQLCIRCDGEVRCYGRDDSGKRVYLSSPDFGLSWNRRTVSDGDPGPVEVSAWIKWGAWGVKKDRPNAQARYALIGGPGALTSAKWDNKDDVEKYALKKLPATDVQVRASFELRGFTDRMVVVQDRAGSAVYISRDDAETWVRSDISSAFVSPAVFERVDGVFVALMCGDDGSPAVSRSFDRGKTWTEPSSDPAFTLKGAEPRFQRLSDNRLLLLLNDARIRNRYRAFLSVDDGRTWTACASFVLDGVSADHPPAPSDVSEMPDGRILVAVGPASKRKLVMFEPVVKGKDPL